MNETILVVDDVPTNRIVTKARLCAMGYNSIMTSTGNECLKIAYKLKPTLILLEMSLPDIRGTDLLKKLRATQVTQKIPIIAICSGNSRETCVSALLAGADDALLKPYNDQLLLVRLRSLLRSQQALHELVKEQDSSLFELQEKKENYTPPGMIALVSEQPENIIRLKHQLSPIMREKIVIICPSEAYGDPQLEHRHADLYLIDAKDSQYDKAQRLLSNLRSRANSRNAGICMLVQTQREAGTRMAFDLGANDVIDSTMSIEEVALRLKIVLRRKQNTDTLRSHLQDGLRMAMTDPLTGLFNRRYAMAHLSHMSKMSLRSGKDIAIMVADLDHFKSVNDRFGHTAGDVVLTEAAKRLSGNLRRDDLIARIGGEEFLIVLPDTDLPTARSIAERLCSQINAKPLASVPKADISVTVSIGLSVWNPKMGINPLHDHKFTQNVIDSADRALLASKSAGRNMVTVAQTI